MSDIAPSPCCVTNCWCYCSEKSSEACHLHPLHLMPPVSYLPQLSIGAGVYSLQRTQIFLQRACCGTNSCLKDTTRPRSLARSLSAGAHSDVLGPILPWRLPRHLWCALKLRREALPLPLSGSLALPLSLALALTLALALCVSITGGAALRVLLGSRATASPSRVWVLGSKLAR